MDEARRGIVQRQFVAEEKRLVARQLRENLTGAEQIMWRALRNRQVADTKFRRQQVIAGFIVDFYANEIALVIEVDGPTHEAQHDAERDAILRGRGMTTLRFTNAEVYNELDRVLTAISAYIEHYRATMVQNSHNDSL